MFDHFVWSVVLCPLLVAAAVRVAADRLRPDHSVPFLAWSMAAAAAASTVNLIAVSLLALAEQPAVGARLGWSEVVVREGAGHVPWVCRIAVALLATAGVAIALVWRRHRRDTAFARRYADLPAGRDGVVIVEDDRAEAFSVPVGGGRIVVTTAMRAGLTDLEYAALLAHERAHLVAKHHRLVRIGRLAAAANPVFWWLGRRMDFLVERDADERAAAALGDRRAVARAVGAAALAAAGAPRAVGLRMTPALGDASLAGAVPRRVASLMAPEQPGSWLLTAVPSVPAGLAAFSVVWTGELVYDLGRLLLSARVGQM